MRWILLAAGTIACVELFLRLPVLLRVRQMRDVVRKVLRTLGSKAISDHWKERALLAYSGQMMGRSLSLLVLLLAVALPLLLACALAAWLGVSLLALLAEYRGMLATLLIASAYAVLRHRFSHG